MSCAGGYNGNFIIHTRAQVAQLLLAVATATANFSYINES